jgi:hypothetical protein
VCESVVLPGIKWTSTEDMTRDFPEPIQCVRLEKPLGTSATTWATWWKLARLIEGLPF